MSSKSYAAVFTSVDDGGTANYFMEHKNTPRYISVQSVPSSQHTNTSRDALHRGDKIVPLAWFNGKIITKGARTYKQLAWRTVFDRVLYPNYPWSGPQIYVEKESDGKVAFDLYWLRANIFTNTRDYSSFMEVSKPKFGESLINHGDYAMADKEALMELKQVKLDLGVLVAEASETIMYFAQYAVAGAKLLHSVRTGRWDQALIQLGVSKRKFKRINVRAKKRFPTKYGKGFAYTGETKSVFGQGIGARGATAYATALLNQAASRHLELQFAIKPLVYTLNDIQSLSGQSLEELQAARVAVKGRHSEKINGGSVSGIYTSKLTINTATKLVVKPTDLEQTVKMAAGLDTFIVPVWEIVPYSWLLDYVIDIGNFLKAATATKGFAFEYGYSSTRMKGTITGEVIDNRIEEPASAGQWDITYFLEKEYDCYVRKVLTTFPLPTINFVLDDISYPHLKNVAALFTILALGTNKSLSKL